MIKIIKDSKEKKVSTPYYSLTYNYMIGDANGNTSEEVEVSVDNPFLERYVSLLNNLMPTSGTWGIILTEDLHTFLKEGQITEDDYNFLKKLMHEDWGESDYVLECENKEHLNEFHDGVRGQAEYSFLVFEGVDLVYVDEYGKKFKTMIVAD